MNKTFNINVAGFQFVINDDAYNLLCNYIQAIEDTLGKTEDSRELINDIESRIAELLLERLSDTETIVTIQNVEDVIRRIGRPEEMIETESTVAVSDEGVESISIEETKSATPPPFKAPLASVKKKLFRDPLDSKLGGVCSGIARYFDCDPTWIRLGIVFVVLASFFFTVFVFKMPLWIIIPMAYVILWIVVPEAKTPVEKMQMMGETPTMENIGKTVTENYKETNKDYVAETAQRKNSFASALASVFGAIAKVILFIGLIIGIPVLIALAFGLLGCIFALIMIGTSSDFFGSGLADEFFGNNIQVTVWGIICGIGGILAIGSPLFYLIRKGIMRGKCQNNPAFNWSICILSVLGFLTCAISVGRLISYTNSQEEYYYNSHRSSEDKTIWEDEWTESTESFVTSDSTTSQPENADSPAPEANVAEGK